MPASDDTNLRKEERKSTSFRARFLVGETSNDCAILDISTGGAQLKSGAPADPKTPITLDLDKLGQFNAVVVWRRGGAIGIKFDDDPARIADAVMALALIGSG